MPGRQQIVVMISVFIVALWLARPAAAITITGGHGGIPILSTDRIRLTLTGTDDFAFDAQVGAGGLLQVHAFGDGVVAVNYRLSGSDGPDQGFLRLDGITHPVGCLVPTPLCLFFELRLRGSTTGEASVEIQIFNPNDLAQIISGTGISDFTFLNGTVRTVALNFDPGAEHIPEPATLLLFGTAAAGLGLARWRRRRAHAHAA